MTADLRRARKRRHKVLLGVFVVLGLLAGAGYAGNLLLMGWIGALAGLLIGAIVALAVSRGGRTAPAPA
jgi:membrane associated rhomboid family serine protease